MRSAFTGTRGLAANGGALIVNVFVSGMGGFAFWIIAARSVEPAAVAQATAMITSILGVVSLSQQSLVVNLPILIAGAFAIAILVERTQTLFRTYSFENPLAFFEKIKRLSRFNCKVEDAISGCPKIKTPDV